MQMNEQTSSTSRKFTAMTPKLSTPQLFMTARRNPEIVISLNAQTNKAPKYNPILFKINQAWSPP